MEIEQEIAVLSARMRFAQEYSAAKGWNFADLKVEQMLEIRDQEGWRIPALPSAPKSRRHRARSHATESSPSWLVSTAACITSAEVESPGPEDQLIRVGYRYASAVFQLGRNPSAFSWNSSHRLSTMSSTS
jgi:hypothetical protein